MQRRKGSPKLISLDHDSSAPDALAAPQADELVEQYVEGRELSALLEQALASPPDAQRSVFVLTQLHHCSLEEVAASENVALGTMKSRLHRARAALVVKMGAALDRAPKKGAGRVAS